MIKAISGLITIMMFIPSLLFSQEPVPPLIENNYVKLTSFDEISSYIRLLSEHSELMHTEPLGKSVKGRDLYAMKFSASEFGKDPSKIRVLIFAQQHGNEQSGKEGALLLVSELLKPENRYLFNRIDLVIVPQVNPDGAEINRRRNANGMDLNRNHLIMTEPETMALHRLFDRYLFEVTMDVHEYSPYGEDWKKYGYRKNADVTVGTTTNLNVSGKIRDLASTEYLPFIFSYLTKSGFTTFEYCPGGPPEIEYIRHSTFDINDGRQSLGIQNTFSFIQEGMNGKDDSVENLQHRAMGQMAGMRGLLEFTYLNKEKIKNLVAEERKKLTAPDAGERISIQSEHVSDGRNLEIPLLSYYSGKDSVVIVKDYRPVVKSLYDVQRPLGYLIPANNKELVAWSGRVSVDGIPWDPLPDAKKGHRIEQYVVHSIGSIDFEGDTIVNPVISVNEYRMTPSDTGFIFIPAAQLKGSMIVLALEPKSMLGLVTYKQFAHLLQQGKPFPVLRVVKK